MGFIKRRFANPTHLRLPPSPWWITAIMVLLFGKFLFPGNVSVIIDWVERVLIIFGLISIGERIVWQAPLRRVPLTGRQWAVVVLLSVLVFVVFEFIFVVVWPYLPHWPNFGYGIITVDVIFWLDMTLGLVLVAVSEEWVFRQLAHRRGALLGHSPARIVFESSAAFALIHLPKGVSAVAITFLFGLIAMMLYRRTGSFFLLVLIHYFVNLASFSGATTWFVERVVGFDLPY